MSHDTDETRNEENLTGTVADLVDPVVTEQMLEGQGSIVGRLAKHRESIKNNRTVDLDIPGYDGELFCRYRLLDGKRLRAIAEKVKRTIKDRDERGIAAALDTLIAACDEFYVRIRTDESVTERPLAQELGQEAPVRYDTSLAGALEFEQELSNPPTARSVALALFVGNEIAIAGHNIELTRWMLSNGAEIDDELLGEAL